MVCETIRVPWKIEPTGPGFDARGRPGAMALIESAGDHLAEV
jgi:hypothetical protein